MKTIKINTVSLPGTKCRSINLKERLLRSSTGSGLALSKRKRVEGLRSLRSLAMTRFMLLAMTLTMLFFFHAQAQTPYAASWPYALEAIQQFERLPYLKLDTISAGQSSYDRSGGNGDSGSFLYTEGQDRVILDLKGPGTLYRLWVTGFSTNTDYIKIYFDGESVPRIDTLLRNIFSGTGAPFLSPLVGDNSVSSGGFYSYLPLSFSKSIKVLTNGSFYYNISYHFYPPDAVITTWTGSEDSTPARNIWSSVGMDPKDDTGNIVVTNTVNLAAGVTQTLLDINGPRSISSIKLRIPGVEASSVSQAQATDDGRAHRGYSQFSAAINPDNQGVVLKRRLDYGIADQKADVYADGLLVGTWYDSGTDTAYRWRDSSFDIPSTFTAGKSSIVVRIVFVSSAVDWNEFFYWIYSKVGGANLLTDSLDVGKSASENSHSYVINTQSWNGVRSFYYLPPSLANSTEILNNIKLRIWWDNEQNPSVEAPLGSFFGMGEFGIYTMMALPVGIDSNDNLYVYFPMPFAENAKVQLLSQRTSSTDNILYEIRHKPFVDPFTNVGYFKTCFNSKTYTAGDRNDILILDTEGAGNFVGVVESMAGASGRGYLEGDERIYVDDSNSPQFYGTGTEDFYNGGWYFNNGLFSLPVHGNTAHVADTLDKTAAYRFFLSDAIPFRKHIRVGIEHGTNNNSTEDVATLAYYYHKPAACATLTDALDVGNTLSEGNHSYTVDSSSWSGLRTYTYEGNFDNVSISDDGRVFNGYSQFRVSLLPSNSGVILRRRFDQGTANQKADVYVDGALVGTWYRAGANTTQRWRDDDFIIPVFFTNGKDQIQVRIQVAPSVINWNEYRYTVYSLTQDAFSSGGDLNNDAQVNILDVQACVNHILGIQDLGNRADVNGDSAVNVLDVQNIVNIILGV